MSVQGKRKKSAALNPVRWMPCSVGRQWPVCLVSHELRLLEPESRGYDPYNKPPPPPVSEWAAEAAVIRRAPMTAWVTA